MFQFKLDNNYFSLYPELCLCKRKEAAHGTRHTPKTHALRTPNHLPFRLLNF